jgi:cell division GTPase FtsZ
MKLILIGVGHAGNHIVDTYYRYSTETEATTVVDAMAVNTSLPDLNSLRHLDRERRVLVGQDEVDGRGVGTDIERGATLLNDDIEDVLYRLDDLNIEAADAFMVVGSLGGGTGGGGVPIICRYLNEHYDLPVLTTSILPSRSETPLHEYNAIVSLRSLVQVADSVFLFDNNQWNESSKSVAASYQEINENIVVYLSALFTAISPGASDTPGTSILDQPDFEKTIEAGRLSVLGYEDLTVRRRKRGGALATSAPPRGACRP